MRGQVVINIVAMGGAIIENLSGKKLSILIGILMACQFSCFLLGGLIGEYHILNYSLSQRTRGGMNDFSSVDCLSLV